MKRILLFLSILGGFLFTFSSFTFANASTNATVPSSDTVTVNNTLTEMSTAQNGVYYVGSDRCPDCIEFEPHLIAYLHQNNLKINEFKVDQYLSNPDIYELMGRLNIEYIPNIVILQNGKVIHNWIMGDNYENMLDEITTYAQQHGVSWTN